MSERSNGIVNEKKNCAKPQSAIKADCLARGLSECMDSRPHSP